MGGLCVTKWKEPAAGSVFYTRYRRYYSWRKGRKGGNSSPLPKVAESESLNGAERTRQEKEINNANIKELIRALARLLKGIYFRGISVFFLVLHLFQWEIKVTQERREIESENKK